MKKQSFLRGASTATIMLTATKFMGIFPLFFLYKELGDTGMMYYSAAYSYYVIALELSTSGIPLGIAKYVSMREAEGDYITGHRILKIGTLTMLGLGILVACFLYIFAEPLSVSITDQSSHAHPNKITTEGAAFVLRMFIPAVILFPVISVIRGFSQGYKDVYATTFSQFIEQFFWLISLLFLFYSGVNITQGNTILAAGFAGFANFIGSFAALLVLLNYLRKTRKTFKEKRETQEVYYPYSWQNLLKKIFLYALPFALVTFSTNLYPIITNQMFNPILLASHVPKYYIEGAFSMITFVSAKFVSLPLIIAIALSTAVLPHLADAFQRNDMAKARTQIKQATQIVIALTLPAALIFVFAGPYAYRSLFYVASDHSLALSLVEENLFQNMKVHIIQLNGFRSIFMGITIISVAMLQSSKKTWHAVIYTILGLAAKALTEPLLLVTFGVYGDVLASFIGYMLTAGLAMHTLIQYSKLNLVPYIKNISKILLAGSIMSIAMYITVVVIKTDFIQASRSLSFIYAGLISIIGAAIYLVAGYVLKIQHYILRDEK